MPILEDGQLFERYRVHKWLGGGVAGESYEAEDRILQRKVTLKLIHPWTTLPDSARRHFFREMQGISLLNHPYLATVLDYGEVDGRVYVARRYVSSGSLLSTNGRLWFHPPLPVRDAFKYAHQLAQALQYIHQHGYVHGSLTFANVLVLRGPDAENSADYTPFLVADAGLAHFVRRFGHPRMETLPVSAAPEQLAKRVAPASDQFALAVLLYFWLAGRPPYLGTSTEIEQQKLSETITPLSILNPGITLEQDSIIMRALMAYPEDRHPSVLAFTEALNTSLTSALRIYAAPLNPFTSQPETPREILQSPENAVPAPTKAPAQPAPTTPQQSTMPAREVPPPAQPTRPQAENTPSALEKLLAKPQEAEKHEVASEEISGMRVEEIELVEKVELVREEIVLFPALPETPRVDESILQAELVAIIPDEPAPANTGTTSTPSLETTLATSANRPPTSAESSLTPPLAEIMPASPEQEPIAEIIPASTEQNGAVEAFPLPIEKEPAGEIFSLSPAQEPVIEAPTAPAEEEPAAEVFPTSREQEPAAEISLTPAEQEPVSETSLELPQEPIAETSLASTEQESTIEVSLSSAQNEPADEISLVPMKQEPVIEVFSADAEQEPVPDELSATKNTEEAANAPDIARQDLITTESEPSLAPDEPVFASSEISFPAPPAEVIPTSKIPSAEPEEVLMPEAPRAMPPAEVVPTEVVLISEIPSAEPLVEKVLTPEVQPTEPSAEMVSISETPPAEPLVEGVATNEEVLTLAEAAMEASANLDVARESDPDIQSLSPIKEAHATNSEAYPLLDEASFAPRLIISSPYTSSSFEFLLVDEEINIGRAGASDLYLEQDNLTSRHHALLKRVGERVLIFDKHSHNGVFLNGQKIEVGRGYELADGDHIGIGNYELIFRSAPSGHVSQLI